MPNLTRSVFMLETMICHNWKQIFTLALCAYRVDNTGANCAEGMFSE